MIFMGEDEKLFRFFEMIVAEIKKRKEILSNYNGDYNAYIQKGNKMPFIVIMINNYEAFDENYREVKVRINLGGTFLSSYARYCKNNQWFDVECLLDLDN